MKTPAVRMGKPDKTTQDFFERISCQNITVWKAREVVVAEKEESITIGVTKFFFFASLTISGAQAAEHA